VGLSGAEQPRLTTKVEVKLKLLIIVSSLLSIVGIEDGEQCHLYLFGKLRGFVHVNGHIFVHHRRQQKRLAELLEILDARAVDLYEVLLEVLAHLVSEKRLAGTLGRVKQNARHMV